MYDDLNKVREMLKSHSSLSSDNLNLTSQLALLIASLYEIVIAILFISILLLPFI